MLTVTKSNTRGDSLNAGDQVPNSIKTFWGIGALGVSVLMNAFSFLVLFYLIGILRIEPALAGFLVFATKLFDVVSDPVVGVWSDRVRSSIGRRRPFLLPGAILSGLSFAMIFTTPIFENQTFTIAYVFGCMLIYTLGYTMFNVPYMSMPAEMTDSFHERSSIHGFRVVFVTIGGLIAGSGFTLLLDELGKNQWSSYAVVGLLGGAIVLVSMSLTFFGTKEARFTNSGQTAPNLIGELAAIRTNKHFVRLISIKACQLFAVAASGSAMVFFIVNTLQLDLKILAVFFLVLSIVSIIATPVLVKLSKEIGKSRAYIVSASCYVLYAASWVFAGPNEPMALMLLRACVVGVAVTGNIMLAMSMLTDTIEYDARITGVRREGVYTAVYSFIEKFTYAFGPLVIGVAMSVAGFDKSLPAEELQSPAVRQAFLLGMAYIPVAMGLISILLIRGYRLDEKALDAAGPFKETVSTS